MNFQVCAISGKLDFHLRDKLGQGHHIPYVGMVRLRIGLKMADDVALHNVQAAVHEQHVMP